jgi:Protein of unknown function (DUF1018)
MSGLIAKLHIAKKQLGLEDSEYRAVLHAATGKESARGMSEAELKRSLAAFEARGFKSASPRAKIQRPPHVRHIYALWGELQGLGAVTRGPKGATALRAFVKRQSGASAPEFLTVQASASVTEALKAMIKRAKETNHA